MLIFYIANVKLDCCTDELPPVAPRCFRTFLCVPYVKFDSKVTIRPAVGGTVPFYSRKSRCRPISPGVVSCTPALQRSVSTALPFLIGCYF